MKGDYMSFINNIFERATNGMLDQAQFEAICGELGIKLADLSTGNYVSKSKYDAELSARDGQINTLNGTIKQRDTDLADLQEKLTAAGADSAKLAEVTSNLQNLQSKYDTDAKQWQQSLKKQSYEFAVKEFANSKKFTSNAARKQFISEMTAAELKMDKGAILGADDFLNTYMVDNADSFVQEEPVEDTKTPFFVNNTTTDTEIQHEDPTGGFGDLFNFTAVRSKE